MTYPVNTNTTTIDWNYTKNLYLSGQTEEAITNCISILETIPTYIDAMNMLGVIAQEQNDYYKALDWFDKALQIQPDNAKIQANKATVLIHLARWSKALVACEASLALEPEDADAWNNRGIVLRHMGDSAAALESFDNALKFNPGLKIAKINRAYVLHELKRLDEAVANFDEILALHPSLAEVWNSRANSLRDLKRPDEALDSYEKALRIAPDNADIWFNKGNLFHSLGLMDKALDCYEKALEFNPQHPKASSLQLHLSQKMAHWEGLEKSCHREKNFLDQGSTKSEPFSLLAMPGVTATDLLQVAKAYVEAMPPQNASRIIFPQRENRKKLRIAYVSADYFMHATAVLMAGVFEAHNRERFEIYAICLGAPSEDPMRMRLRRAFDHFIETSSLSNAKIAELMRQNEIDIAVDLKGHTEDSRFGIFLHGAAPIQVTYLGFPGTTGSNHIDYIIGDKWVTPFEHEEFYSEKIVQMPVCYQCNDIKRIADPITPLRRQVGLPENSFVFCSFNNTYKINPGVFDMWMRILKAVPGSVLWLLQDNATAVRNLRMEARLRGVAPERLVFAPRVSHPQHLARHRVADLFLDTLPYNAHTTTSDALRAGLPVLTQLGETFAGRVAASLISSIGLPELIVNSAAEYEQLAIHLATHPDELCVLRSKLKSQLPKAALFDTVRFTRDLEKAYMLMWQRYEQNQPPQHISVP